MALTKVHLIFFIVAASALWNAQSKILDSPLSMERGDLILGNTEPSDVLVYTANATRAAVFNVITTQDVVYRGFGIYITKITAIEDGVSQNASAVLVDGGIGHATATIRQYAANVGAPGVVSTENRYYMSIRVNPAQISHVYAIDDDENQQAWDVLIDGGIRRSSVDVRFISMKSKGYNYTVSVYGRYI